jgi:hypothetical protein
MRPHVCLQLLHDLTEAEARCLLPRRIFLEGLQELPYLCLRGNQQVRMVEEPVPVCVRVYVRKLERISAQVEDSRKPQHDEGVCPDLTRATTLCSMKQSFQLS